MMADQKRLDSLIEDLNTCTFIDDPWFVEFVNAKGVLQVMGNHRRLIKSGIWISAQQQALEVNPRIRIELEQAQSIVRVCCFGLVKEWESESIGEQ